MHHVRGLIRPAAAKTLKRLESVSTVHTLQECFRNVELQDSHGQRCATKLLHPSALMTHLDGATSTEALSTLDSTLATLREAMNVATCNAPVLYVKGGAEACRDEIMQREQRFILKLRGRELASDTQATSAFIEHLLYTSSVKGGHGEDDCSVYYGLLEGLCTSDPPSAIAVGVNSKLPPLNATTANCLSALVDVQTPSAITTFLTLVREKDSLVAAHERCATHLAVRVRQSAPQHMGLVCDNALSALDPSVVFPTNAEEIQKLVMRQVAVDESADLPARRAEAVMSLVGSGQWLPRRVAMTCLGAICLTDLERPWLLSVVGAPCRHTGAVKFDKPSVEAAATRRAARALIVKDARRNLVDNRLLHEYADLLRDGLIETRGDGTFGSFLEECGECHGACDRPSAIDFTFASSACQGGASLRQCLSNLAPGCSYWTTLLQHRPERVSAWVAPCGDVRVHVELPEDHECCAAVRDEQFFNSLPVEVREPRVLWEDEHVLAVDKPAGVATSRHALSTTQAGVRTTDLLSCLLRARPALKGVFREGQVHRLDTGTSGCLLFAKTPAAAASLRHQMGTSAAYSHFSKTYWALCAVLEHDLAKVPLKGVLHDRADSKVQTAYRVVTFFPAARAALVECRLQQGKKHQVRRHLATAGLPLLGDVDHGGATCCHPLLDRVALHAKTLTFVHPISASTVSVAAPLPTDFQKALTGLSEKKWS